MFDLYTHLMGRGFRVEQLARDEARERFDAWCGAFLADVKASSGSYRYRGLHWHAFSYGIVAAAEGSAACDAYARLNVEPVTIIPEDWSRGCGVRATGEVLPDLAGCGADLYVFPDSLAWSMTFTRDDVHGPYFLMGRSE